MLSISLAGQPFEVQAQNALKESDLLRELARNAKETAILLPLSKKQFLYFVEALKLSDYLQQATPLARPISKPSQLQQLPKEVFQYLSSFKPVQLTEAIRTADFLQAPRWRHLLMCGLAGLIASREQDSLYKEFGVKCEKTFSDESKSMMKEVLTFEG